MKPLSVRDRRGGATLLVLVGLLVLAIWVGTDHTGRLARLVMRQRDLLSELRSTDIPGRPHRPAPCLPGRIEAER
ncbi:MAG TPA: hypothetical protein PLP29_00880 [Candidatus Ozemobacteraceae bacterium]|nr:hypothetical protein [Candidatus Ozemobacteraceae bacterium]